MGLWARSRSRLARLSPWSTGFCETGDFGFDGGSGGCVVTLATGSPDGLLELLQPTITATPSNQQPNRIELVITVSLFERTRINET